MMGFGVLPAYKHTENINAWASRDTSKNSCPNEKVHMPPTPAFRVKLKSPPAHQVFIIGPVSA